MSSLPTAVLVLIFLGSAAAIWAAGVRLASTTDALDQRLGIGSAFGGLIVLAVATNLPEIVITIGAALQHQLGLAVGNLVGGIAIQTVVLAVLDARSGKPRPLTYLAASLLLVIEATTVILVLALVFMGTRLPESTSALGISPASVAIVLLWISGLLLVRRAQQGIPWQVHLPEAEPGRSPSGRRGGPEQHRHTPKSTGWIAAVFAAMALITLAAGVLVERSGEQLAGTIGLQGAVFGATFLAAATALPELSTGLASVRIGDNQLAVSDIFGGNAFLPVLFLIADVLAGTPALPAAARTDQWMAGLGIVLTATYIIGFILRPARKILGMGPDSLAVITLYVLGIAGLLLI
ncbi:MAG: sodium:calcium antiporter [Solirubrobacterales bacterium]|nr:sodium:calcium antiporter [Solirubrobacterales bacterium]